jgi:hypothetical protein
VEWVGRPLSEGRQFRHPRRMSERPPIPTEERKPVPSVLGLPSNGVRPAPATRKLMGQPSLRCRPCYRCRGTRRVLRP